MAPFFLLFQLKVTSTDLNSNHQWLANLLSFVTKKKVPKLGCGGEGGQKIKIAICILNMSSKIFLELKKYIWGNYGKNFYGLCSSHRKIQALKILKYHFLKKCYFKMFEVVRNIQTTKIISIIAPNI